MNNERKLSVDNAVALVQGLMESFTLTPAGNLELPFFELPPGQVQQRFGLIGGQPLTNTAASLFRVLDALHHRFPRITSPATFARFTQVLNANPPALVEGQDQQQDPKLVALHASEGHPGEDLEAFHSLVRGLLLGVQFLVSKQGDATEIVNTYKSIMTNVADSQDLRLQHGLIEEITTDELKDKARVLLRSFKHLKELLENFGRAEPQAYFVEEPRALVFAQILGYQETGFNFVQLQTAVENKRSLDVCQVFLPTDIMDSQELTALRDLINVEAQAVKDLKPSESESSYLGQAAQLLAAKVEDVNFMTLGERQDFVGDVSRIENEIFKLKISGRNPVDEDLIKKLREGRTTALALDEEEKEKRRINEKLETEKRTQKLKEIGVVKLCPLHSIRNWLPWLSQYQEMIYQTEVSDIKKLALILSSLKNEEDKKNTKDLPLESVSRYLHEKYHKVDLILSIHQQDLLSMKKAKSESESEVN